MDRTVDLLGISSPLYYRLILIEGAVKRNSLPLFGDYIPVYPPRLPENYLRTAQKKVVDNYSLRFHSISCRLPFRINPTGRKKIRKSSQGEYERRYRVQSISKK
jgi:hypothetical protein